MEQFLSLWVSLGLRRQLTVIISGFAMFAAILVLGRMATEPRYSLLYSGLDAQSAGVVVDRLEQQGAAYDVRGGSVYVESTMRDELRMRLASEGLPANSTNGYELLDNISGFGTTAQMFDAAYWRAKEGELARTIVAGGQVSSARVHISNVPGRRLGKVEKSSASVTVTPNSGQLSAANAKAYAHLVASAVAGMLPSDVAVIDGRNGIIVAQDIQSGLAAGETVRAVELKSAVERLLESHVGVGKAIVEVNIETVMDTEAIVQRSFDPDSRIAISSDTEETSQNQTGSSTGGVTVASNLPEGDAGGNAGSSTSQNTQTRERINYEVSETTREVVKPAGSIRRISAAVIVDGRIATDPATGAETWSPRSEGELADLRELVASAIGFDEARGDSLTVKSLQFEELPELGTSADTSLIPALGLDVMKIIQTAVLSLVAIILGLFVVRPILTAAPDRAGEQAALGQVPLVEQNQDGSSLDAPPALTGEIDDSPLLGEDLPVVDFGDPFDGAGSEGDPIDRLRTMIEDRKDETVDVLKTWIEDEEELAG